MTANQDPNKKFPSRRTAPEPLHISASTESQGDAEEVRQSAKNSSSNQLYKTKLCVHFQFKGACTYGDGCSFAHGPGELVKAPTGTGRHGTTVAAAPGPAGHALAATNSSSSRYKTELCIYFPAGHCNKGENCSYAHGYHELRTQGPKDASSLASQNTKTAMRNAPTGTGRHGTTVAAAPGPAGHALAATNSSSSLYKTWPCIFFAQGHCNKGEDCDYAHGSDELRTPAPKATGNRKTRMCNDMDACEDHKEGRCRYAHRIEELQPALNTEFDEAILEAILTGDKFLDSSGNTLFTDGMKLINRFLHGTSKDRRSKIEESGLGTHPTLNGENDRALMLLGAPDTLFGLLLNSKERCPRLMSFGARSDSLRCWADTGPAGLNLVRDHVFYVSSKPNVKFGEDGTLKYCQLKLILLFVPEDKPDKLAFARRHFKEVASPGTGAELYGREKLTVNDPLRGGRRMTYDITYIMARTECIDSEKIAFEETPWP